MSNFSNIIWGSFGDEKQTSSTKTCTIGQRMILPDGREFVYGKASATALVAGKLYQQGAGYQASDAGLTTNAAVAANAAIGSATVQITAGATTAVTTNQFADGTLLTNDATGEGYIYRILSNNSAAAGSTVTLTLYPNDTIKVALAAGTSEVGVKEALYSGLTQTTADTVGVGALAGIAPVAVTANYYCWIQRKGECAALTDGTVIVGVPVTPSGAASGAVAVFTASTTNTVKQNTLIGWCENVSASTEYSLINLTLD